MAIWKKEYVIEDFNYLMNCCKAIITTYQNRDELDEDSARRLRIYQDLYDSMKKYAFVRKDDIHDGRIVGVVHCSFTDDIYDYVVLSISWNGVAESLGINDDYTDFLIEKHNEYMRKREMDKERIIEKWNEFLASKEKKKTKRNFADLYGFSYYQVIETLRNK